MEGESSLNKQEISAAGRIFSSMGGCGSIRARERHLWLIRVKYRIEVRYNTSSKGKSSGLLFNPDHQFTEKKVTKEFFRTIKNIS